MLPALALVVAVGCGGGADPAPVPTRPSVTASPTRSAEDQFVDAARAARMGRGGTDAEVVATGRQACGLLDRGVYDVDSASEAFATLTGSSEANARVYFEAAVEHLCPEHSDLL